ncbi:MAG: hypothetical protein ACI822_000783 [Gammaproteobacteria bacterium]|jgi:hypothetical protein
MMATFDVNRHQKQRLMQVRPPGLCAMMGVSGIGLSKTDEDKKNPQTVNAEEINPPPPKTKRARKKTR